MTPAIITPRAGWVLIVLALGCSSPPMPSDRPTGSDSSHDGSTRLLDDGSTAGDDASVPDAAAAPDTGARPPGTGGGCGAAPGANDRTWTVEVDGRTRRFAVHLPSGYDPSAPTPVVIDLHGRNSTASQEMVVTGMRGKADRAGFIAVHPEGVDQTWNAGICCGSAMSENIDDVGFVDAILDALEAELCVDTGRVFATGLSNGGYMAHRLACDLADRISAVAPVAGPNGTSPCRPSRPVSVLHFHGTEDDIVPFDGFAGFFGVRDTMREWADRNGCSSSSEVYLDMGDVRCERWPGCDDGVSVELCTIDGGGHQWPGGTTIPFLGDNTDDIEATDAMWTFFEAHGR